MKKINLKGISEILSEKELKNVMGGSGTICNSSKKECTSNSDCGRNQYCTSSGGKKCCF